MRRASTEEEWGPPPHPLVWKWRTRWFSHLFGLFCYLLMYFARKNTFWHILTQLDKPKRLHAHCTINWAHPSLQQKYHLFNLKLLEG